MSNIIPLDFHKIIEEKESEITLSRNDAMENLKARILKRKEALKILNDELENNKSENNEPGYDL